MLRSPPSWAGHKRPRAKAFCARARPRLVLHDGAERIHQWARIGVHGRTHRSPSDGRPKACAWVVIDLGDRGQLTVWDSGDGELEFLSADGRVTQKHFDDLTDDSVVALGELESFLRGPPS
jgi:hypothetical protein